MGILHKEIPSQQPRNTEQYLRVNAVVVENSVARHAAGAKLLRQPCHRTSLRTQFFLNDVPDVDGFCHNVCNFGAIAVHRHMGLRQDTKNVDISYPHSEVLRKPMLKDKSCPRITQTFTTCSSQHIFEISQVSECSRTNSKRYDL